MAPSLIFFFFYFPFGHLQGVAGVRGGRVKVGPKKQTLGISFPRKLKIFKDYSKFVCFCEITISGENFSKIGAWVRTQQLPKKGHFMNTESVRKYLKIFNLTKDECHTDKTYHNYLHKIFNFGCKRAYTKGILEWAIKSAFWLNFYEHSDSSNNHTICYALPHI